MVSEMYKLALPRRVMNQANRLFRRSNLQSGRIGASGIAPYDQCLVRGLCAVERIGGEAVSMLFSALTICPRGLRMERKAV
jgi:hypothetical protein